jgi:hypothetical protein
MTKSTNAFSGEAVGLTSNQNQPIKRKKYIRSKIPNFGHLKKRGRMMRNSNNLRFKELYKPISSPVLIIFCAIVFFLYWFLRKYVPSLSD